MDKEDRGVMDPEGEERNLKGVSTLSKSTLNSFHLRYNNCVYQCRQLLYKVAQAGVKRMWLASVCETEGLTVQVQWGGSVSKRSRNS